MFFLQVLHYQTFVSSLILVSFIKILNIVSILANISIRKNITFLATSQKVDFFLIRFISSQKSTLYGNKTQKLTLTRVLNQSLQPFIFFKHSNLLYNSKSRKDLGKKKETINDIMKNSQKKWYRNYRVPCVRHPKWQHTAYFQ